MSGLSIGGDWTGVFDYDGDGGDPVAFTAKLSDVIGVIWGETAEPNSFAPGEGTELYADISGMRSGREVHFRKVYEGAPKGGEYPVEYFGHVNADGTHISGRWRIHAGVSSIAGPFVMDRPKSASATREKTGRARESVR